MSGGGNASLRRRVMSKFVHQELGLDVANAFAIPRERILNPPNLFGIATLYRRFVGRHS
jgi:hypothetical protein